MYSYLDGKYTEGEFVLLIGSCRIYTCIPVDTESTRGRVSASRVSLAYLNGSGGAK